MTLFLITMTVWGIVMHMWTFVAGVMKIPSRSITRSVPQLLFPSHKPCGISRWKHVMESSNTEATVALNLNPVWISCDTVSNNYFLLIWIDRQVLAPSLVWYSHLLSLSVVSQFPSFLHLGRHWFFAQFPTMLRRSAASSSALTRWAKKDWIRILLKNLHSLGLCCWSFARLRSTERTWVHLDEILHLLEDSGNLIAV